METGVGKSVRAGALLTAGIVFALIAGGEAQAQAKQVLRYSNAASPSDYHVRGVQVFKDELEKSLPGRFDIQIFPSGAMFKQGTEMAALQRGNLELAHFNFQDLRVCEQFDFWHLTSCDARRN